jgi:putative ABC transport system permease protein
MLQMFNWFRRRALENDFDRELSYHLDRRVNELVSSGLSETEARRQAALDLGGVTQVREEVRDVWLSRWLRDFMYDLRFSARAFLRSPSFTGTAVLSFALGIGATAAMYSLLDQVVLHALPVREPERLVLIDWKGDQAAVNAFGSYNLMSYPMCRDLQKQDRFFEGVLCRALTTVTFSSGGEHSPTSAEIVSGTYFSVLDINPALGRLFTVNDDQPPRQNPVVVLSHSFWKSQLAGDPLVIGRKVWINRRPMTVIGVAAPGFHGIDVGEVPSVWIPGPMSAEAIPGFTDVLNRRVRWMQVLGRLQPDVTLAQAQTGLQPWFKSTLNEDVRRADFPKVTAERRQLFLASTLELTPAPQGHAPLRRRLSQPLWVLFIATALLLGLACLNVAGLFLARGSAREREISTRFALGASRGRIGRQLMADSLLIALAGGLLGVMLAPLAMKALISFLPRNTAANALHSAIDGRVLVFATLVSIAAGLFTGLTPALQTGRGSLMATLRQHAGSGLHGLRLRRVIVTAQIAFTLVLLTGAALFIKTLTALMEKGPGFETSSLISFGIDPVQNGYSPAAATRLVRRIHDELHASPITRSVAVARVQLLNGGSWNNPMTIDAGERIITDREVHQNAVTPGFFSTLGAKIVAGRGFDERDMRLKADGGKLVAIVNEAFAKRYLSGRNPIGCRVALSVGPLVQPEIEVVGVVSNINYRAVREQWEQAYVPIMNPSASFYEGGNFYVRVQGSADTAYRSIREILRDADPTLPVTYFRTLDEQVRRSLNTERMLAALSGSFGTLAVLLSLVGLYGVLAFVVTQRTREIGIRLALGATRAGAAWVVLRDALLMLAMGIAIALPCIWAVGRLVESQLYDVKPTDPATIVAAVCILAAGAVAAALIPARRASTISPSDALRFE